MSRLSLASDPEWHAFEVDSMSVNGSVTELGGGRCSVNVSFEDRSSTEPHRLRFASVDRASLATLFRSFADSLEPPHGLTFHIWCELHVANLEGKPQWIYDPIAQTWNTDLSNMECPHDGTTDSRTDCMPEWRIGSAPAKDKEAQG